jgi:hypothetical protein
VFVSCAGLERFLQLATEQAHRCQIRSEIFERQLCELDPPSARTALDEPIRWIRWRNRDLEWVLGRR